MPRLIYSETEREGSGLKMKKKRFSEWVIVLLIILFFAIPLCSLLVNESVVRWPTSPTRFIYHFLVK
jgi:hypothetical protein